MNQLFPQGIKLPSITSVTAGPYKGAGPTGGAELDDSDALMASIMNGDGPGDTPASTQGGSKLESSLKGLPNASPNNLDGALADVKVWAPYKSTRWG
jgi:hypothetical protein